jgi:hypothetical protein
MPQDLKKSAFFGGYGLKGRNLLFDPNAFALWAPDFFLFIFGDCHHQGERLFAFFANELICGHGKPPSVTGWPFEKITSGLWNTPNLVYSSPGRPC